MFTELLETILSERSKVDEFSGGWIPPNGKIIWIPNYDFEDHWRDAYRKITGKKGRPPSMSQALDAYEEYLDQGNIRILKNETKDELNIDLRVKPSSSQMKSLGKLAREAAEFRFEIGSDDPWETVDGYSWREFREAVRDLRTAEK